MAVDLTAETVRKNISAPLEQKREQQLSSNCHSIVMPATSAAVLHFVFCFHIKKHASLEFVFGHWIRQPAFCSS